MIPIHPTPMRYVYGNEVRFALSTTPQNNQALPTLENGQRPDYIAVVHDGSDTFHELVKIAFGQSGATTVITTAGFPVPAHEVVVFNVTGFTHYAIVGKAAGTDTTIIPLEIG